LRSPFIRHVEPKRGSGPAPYRCKAGRDQRTSDSLTSLGRVHHDAREERMAFHRHEQRGPDDPSIAHRDERVLRQEGAPVPSEELRHPTLRIATGIRVLHEQIPIESPRVRESVEHRQLRRILEVHPPSAEAGLPGSGRKRRSIRELHLGPREAAEPERLHHPRLLRWFEPEEISRGERDGAVPWGLVDDPPEKLAIRRRGSPARTEIEQADPAGG